MWPKVSVVGIGMRKPPARCGQRWLPSAVDEGREHRVIHNFRESNLCADARKYMESAVQALHGRVRARTKAA